METVYTYGDLYLEFPENILAIEKLHIAEEFNRHGLAQVEMKVLTEKEFRFIDHISPKTLINVVLKKNEAEDCIFYGFMSNITVQKQDMAYRVKLTLKSTTYLLDYKKLRRSFQDKTNPYKNLFDTVIKTDDPGAGVFIVNDSVQEDAIIQYDETNWQFILRLASKLSEQVIPNVKSAVPFVRIGVQQGHSHQEPTRTFHVDRQNAEYLKSELNYGGWQEEDAIYFKIKSVHSYELSDTVIYKEVTFKIYRKETALENGLIIFHYWLVKENGLKARPMVNHHILGAAISGKIIAVKNDRVKMHLSIDKEQPIDKAYWYKWETAYTSEGQTGLYSMPQIGDDANLYTPTEYIEDAYVRIVNRLDGGSNLKIQKPDVKYWGNIHKKELMLAPTEVQATATNGMILLNMDNEDGIEFTSSADIIIQTQDSAAITGNKIGLLAMNEIRLATKHSGIALNENIHMKADGGVNL